MWTTRALGLHTKPVVLLDTDGYYRGLVDWLRGLVPAGFVAGGAMELVARAGSVAAAFEMIEGFVDGSADPSRDAVQPGSPHG